MAGQGRGAPAEKLLELSQAIIKEAYLSTKLVREKNNRDESEVLTAAGQESVTNAKAVVVAAARA